MLFEGQQIDRYHVMHRVASGGMSEIYLAQDTHINRQVAIKIIRPEIVSDSDTEAFNEAVRLFQIEAKAITLLDHPRILPLFDYGMASINESIFTFMVMPFRPQGSLTNWIQKRSRTRILSLTEVAHFLRQATEALQHAHDHEIIHRDVKPSNFLILSDKKNSGYPDIQLADFGVAKFMNAISTPTHTIRGTPIYMAPEQWRGDAVFQTDQYALAIMIYELLTGRVPFRGKNQQQVLYQHIYVQPSPPSTFNARIPLEIDTVLIRALSKNPADRYASISDFGRAFQQALRHGDDAHITLTINPTEARLGARRSVTLLNGRSFNISIPPGVYDGQVLRFEGLEGSPNYIGTTRALIVTIAITKVESITSLANSELLDRTISDFDNDVVFDNTPQGVSKGKKILLLGLAILLVLSGVGWIISSKNITHSSFSSNPSNVTATHGANARATTQANRSATTAALNAAITASAESATATAAATAATATASAVAATATTTAYTSTITTGNLALNDPLQDNSQGNNWDVAPIAGGGGCAFTGGAYHSSMPQKGFFSPCFARATNFGNFSYQVQMTIVSGDQGGICFRANSDKGTFYYFHINTDGLYALEIYNNYISVGTLKEGSSAAIKTDLNQPNLIAVVANGNNLDLYVNMQHIFSVTDSTYTQGQIGVVAESLNNPTDVIFSNVQVWTR